MIGLANDFIDKKAFAWGSSLFYDRNQMQCNMILPDQNGSKKYRIYHHHFKYLMRKLALSNNHNSKKMKRLMLVSLLLMMCITWGFSQTKVTTSTGLYQKADLSSKRIATLFEGESVTLGQVVGDFYEAINRRGKSGYVHKTCLENYEPPIQIIEQTKIEPTVSQNQLSLFLDKPPGNDLISASNLALTGIGLQVGSGIVSLIGGMSVTDQKGLNNVLIVSGVMALAGLICEITGWVKVKKAGQDFILLGISPASSGIGLSFRIND